MAVLLQHIVDKLAPGSGWKSGAVIYFTVFRKYAVAKFIVDTIQSAAVCIDIYD